MKSGMERIKSPKMTITITNNYVVGEIALECHVFDGLGDFWGRAVGDADEIMRVVLQHFPVMAP